MLSDGSVIDSSGNVIGKAVDYGYVYDDEGNIVGRVLADGSVIDLDGNIIGKLDKDGNAVDFNGSIIGHIAKSGEIITDESGNMLGIVMPNGDVVNEDGDVIGRVDAEGNLVAKQRIGRRGSTAQLVFDDKGKVISSYLLPGSSYIQVEEGAMVKKGQIIAKLLTAGAKTKDITGGLPRVGELFEARKPRNVAVLAAVVVDPVGPDSCPVVSDRGQGYNVSHHR